jgi:hypothetical protein
MNPNQDGRYFLLMASGLYLRPGKQGRPGMEQSLLSRSQSDLNDPWQPRATANKSPYPGINIGSGSELLDFRFEDTEILQEREE